MHELNVFLSKHYVKLFCESIAAKEMLHFLFGDIQNQDDEANLEATFALLAHDAAWRVIRLDKNKTVNPCNLGDGKVLYQSEHLTDAANYLMGEVVFHLIENNQQQMALHAGLLSDEHGGILLPAESGSGKSSLSIWMTLNGYQYHTDELVLIEPSSHATQAFTRPFNIKKHGVDAINRLLDIDALKPKAAIGDFITMIPHRALNPRYKTESPSITRILFPKYDKNADNTLTSLSGAAAGIELMKCNVIARNLPGHGFRQLLDIVKSIPAYKLYYNHFDVLPELLSKLLSK